MNSKFRLVIAVILIAFVVTQCKKKTADEPVVEDPSPSTPGITTMTEVFAAVGSQNQTYTVSATAASTLNVNGVVIEIPANSFETTTSGTVTGVISVTVKTILTKSQIILSGAGANSTSSRLVTTKGCVKVTASQNTQSLRLTNTGTVSVKVPDGTTFPSSSMKKFYASKVSASDSTLVWDLGTDVSNIPFSMDTMSATYQHNATLDSLKWLNVGVLWDSVTTNKSPVIINTDPSFDNTNCAVYLSLNGSLTVGAAFQLIPGKFRISNMPNGRGVNLIGIGVKNGQYYFDAISVLTGSAGYNLNLVPKSMSQIQTLLSALP